MIFVIIGIIVALAVLINSREGKLKVVLCLCVRKEQNNSKYEQVYIRIFQASYF